MATDQPADGSGLFAEQKADLDDEWHDTFDELTAQGRAPSSIKATIEYVTTPKTQQEISREFNVSEVTIRNLQAAVVALGPIDARRDSQHHSHKGGMTIMDYCNHLSDRLGWEEGFEYAVTENAYGSTPTPSLKKEGWRSLFEHIAE